MRSESNSNLLYYLLKKMIKIIKLFLGQRAILLPRWIMKHDRYGSTLYYTEHKWRENQMFHPNQHKIFFSRCQNTLALCILATLTLKIKKS